MTERRNIDWAVGHIIQSAGIPLDEADDRIIRIAEECKERCYYIDAAARELIDMLDGRRR
jgi:hypothetical protein